MKAKTKTKEDCLGGGRHVVIPDSLCGRDEILLFICNAFLSCGFWGIRHNHININRVITGVNLCLHKKQTPSDTRYTS